MLEKQIVDQYRKILSRLERGYMDSLEDLITNLLLHKYNLSCDINQDIYTDDYIE